MKVYFRESSRTLFTRSNQHINDFRKASRQVLHNQRHLNSEESSSLILDHTLEAHGGPQNLDPENDIMFSVKRQQRDSLTKHLHQSVIIHWGLERMLTYGPKDKPEAIDCLFIWVVHIMF